MTESTSTPSHSQEFFATLLDRPIAYHRCFVELTGSVTAAVMLSQAVYWSQRTKPNKYDWFWKTQEEWQEETGLTRTEQEGARKSLRGLGFWKEERRGLPAKMFYFIDYKIFTEILHRSKGSQSRVEESCDPDCGKPANLNAENQQSFLTEITSESTTENTKELSHQSVSSPLAGERPYKTQTQKPSTNFGFNTFWNSYPKHRIANVKKAEREARDAWNDPELSHDNHQLICSSLIGSWVDSEKWKEKGGQYIPSPENFIKRRHLYWENQPTNHKMECAAVLNYFLEATGKQPELCEMTEARREMLSARWDDAIRKATGHKPDVAMTNIEAAIDARIDFAEKKGRGGRVTLESIFESTETFERWIEEAVSEE